jgi:hypothetical protein
VITNHETDRFTPSNTAPKKYQNSGLRKNQQANRAPETPDPFLNGGLDDEDAISVPPLLPGQTHKPPMVTYPEVLQRDHSRKNNVCGIFVKIFTLIQFHKFLACRDLRQ